MKIRSTTFIRILFIALALLLGFRPAAFSAEKLIVGWVENIRITPGFLKIKAKLDTGALNSSMHVIQVDEFERQGEKWVRFNLNNRRKRSASIETKVVRTARIKEHGRESATRLVVRLGICLGDVFKETEVNLEDRSGFNYQMLIGRTFLKGSFVIDPARKFTVYPQCRGLSDP